ncbi:hypothetical protein GCM10023215_40060 [Pseudonocardia yuanmonensis]|uniref:Uncharacterized protein n=1 Tax=Pseudonocardia yuanmonensis TaxID=1095914 RepID=A0ABP8X0G5_9PSEU
MSDVHRADVLVRWAGLLPFVRGAAAPEQPTPPATPWQTGRRRPVRRAVDAPSVPSTDAAPRADPTVAPEPATEVHAGPATLVGADPAGPAEPEAAGPAGPAEPIVTGPAGPAEPIVTGPAGPPEPVAPERAELDLPLHLVPGPPPLPVDPPPLDLGRATPEPEPLPLVDPLLFRGLARSSTGPSAPRRQRRGAVIDGIEHRPPVRPDPHIVGLSRRLRGRVGSRAFTLVFLGIYLLILVQLIVSLMNG